MRATARLGAAQDVDQNAGGHGDVSGRQDQRAGLFLCPARPFSGTSGTLFKPLDLADNLFLLGLFSLLEPILERTYPQILKDFSLPRDVESALLGQGGSLLPWLEFINILDDGNWLRVDVAAMHLNLDLRCVSRQA